MIAEAPVPQLRTDDIIGYGLAAGLAKVGVTTVDPLEPARSVLPLRKLQGRHASMAFTYKNPDRSTDPSRTLRNAASCIVAVYDYHGRSAHAPSAPTPNAAWVARYCHVDAYAELRSRLEEIAVLLRSHGARARVIADQNDLVDRNLAYRAGLGAYGKNSNLLVDDNGSWFVIGTIVTDYELAPTGPPQPDPCGSCNECMTRCPTNAIVAPGVVDARRCLAWLLQGPDPVPIELRTDVGNRIYGCDECQVVCPPNRRRPASSVAVQLGERPFALLLGADDATLLDHVGQWYIANRDPNVVRRSALVAFANTVDPANPMVVPTLRRYLSSDVEQLVCHAIWAAKRLGHERLIDEEVRLDSAAVDAERRAEVPTR